MKETYERSQWGSELRQRPHSRHVEANLAEEVIASRKRHGPSPANQTAGCKRIFVVVQTIADRVDQFLRKICSGHGRSSKLNWRAGRYALRRSHHIRVGIRNVRTDYTISIEQLRHWIRSPSFAPITKPSLHREEA